MAKRSASELFENYYRTLIYLLPMKDASFVDNLLKYDLLPGDLKIRLASFTMNNQRASYFLDNVIKPGLAVGNSRCFFNLLTVIKSSEHDNCKELAREIENELAINIKCKNIYCIIIVEIRVLIALFFIDRFFKAHLKRFAQHFDSQNSKSLVSSGHPAVYQCPTTKTR